MHIVSNKANHKEKLRISLKEARAKIKNREEKSGVIQKSVLKLLLEDLNVNPIATNVLAYSNINTEVSTLNLLSDLLIRNFKLYLPLCTQDIITPIRIHDISLELEPGHFNILEPKIELSRETARIIPAENLNIIFVPGLGFDHQGNRLGLGKGFYDRFLPLCNKAIKIGLAFEEQITDQIPTEEFDQKVDIIITDIKIIRSKS